jgi:PAS domain S-box-containing protein
VRLMRRKTEQALKGAELRYRQIVNTAQEGIWVLDAEDQTTYVNKYMARMLGYAEHEMIGRGLAEFLDDAAVVPSRGFIGQTELKLRHKTGGAVWGLISSSQMTDENQNYGGMLGMVTDVTDRKRAEEEREQLVQELKETVRVRDEFLSVASHELRTPITTLKLNVQLALLMRDRGEETISPALAAKLDVINRQVNRITELIDSLLDVTRMSNRKLSYEFVELNLADIVRDTAARFNDEARRSNISLYVDAPPVLSGMWDKLRIEQVIANLLSNALRHGNHMPVEVCLLEENGMAKLVVRDQGPGIPAESQEKIFDRFEQGTQSRKVGGLGLGLYIVKQIVDAHGGSIRVESEPGYGSSFIVHLPLRRGIEKTPNKKILIVEDDRDVVDALSELLKTHGYEVESALNGREALDLLHHGKRPGLILLDLMMPVMDGMQFREAQTADRNLADIPVVVMSAHPKGKEIMRSIRAQGYLKKPVEIGAILETVDRVSLLSGAPGAGVPAKTRIKQPAGPGPTPD